MQARTDKKKQVRDRTITAELLGNADQPPDPPETIRQEICIAETPT